MKTRRGAKVSKTFDKAQTPCQRVLASPEVAEEAKEALRQTYLGLNPAELRRKIERCQDQLIEMARTKPDRGEEVKPSPDHPWKVPFGEGRSRTSMVRQPMDASRTS